MNTPAHVIVNALVLGRGEWRGLWRPITIGAVAPDVPLVAFFVYERFICSVPDEVIWSQTYFTPHWQAVFDTSHSLPLLAGAACVAYAARARGLLALFTSMALHSIADFPLHHDDAHAHFFPLSAWKFRSPISYWDPRHYGTLVAPLEVLLVAAGAYLLLRRPLRAWRVIGASVLAIYAAFLSVAFFMWGSGAL